MVPLSECVVRCGARVLVLLQGVLRDVYGTVGVGPYQKKECIWLLPSKFFCYSVLAGMILRPTRPRVGTECQMF